MSNTFAQYIQEATRRLYSEHLHVVQIATGTGGAAGATLIDARLIDNTTDADTSRYERVYVRIPIQTTPAWSEECIRQIGTYTPASGTLTPIDPFGFSYSGTGVTTTDTTLTDARRAWATDEHVGDVVTCNSKTMTVTGNTATILTGASWSGGSNPGNGHPYSIGSIVPADCQYEIHYDLPPNSLKECINRALRGKRRQWFGGLSELADGDMETSTAATIATYWTASNCTPTKITTAAYVRHGAQSTRVLNSAANGYIKAATAIPVIEGQRWLIPAYVRCAVGTATLIPWDDTNNAAITTTGDGWSTDESAWTELGTGETIEIPSGCEALNVHLRGTGASDDIYWDSVLPINVDQAIINLPSWLNQEDYLLGLFTLPKGEEASGGGYEVGQNWEEREYDWMPLVDEMAANPWRIEVPTPISRSLFIKAKRPWAELTLDTDTSNADLDVTVNEALGFVEELRGRYQESDRWRDQASGLQRDHGHRPTVIQRVPYTSRSAR